MLHDWTQGTRKGRYGEEPDPYYVRSGDYTVCRVITKARGTFFEAWHGRTRLGDAPTERGAQDLVEAHAGRCG